jgi:hypothetical protein
MRDGQACPREESKKRGVTEQGSGFFLGSRLRLV